MSYALEKGHESGQMPTDGSLKQTTLDVRGTPTIHVC
jgi:hypothetical protein